ncbi:hypothetical protein WA026_009713 [Henosepilachna vigintioctopunctata]|uniref:SHD domain-containing protein n=1 Tax=Henosepilachna vigintioctopunctata TaxID=420089 RepID=A0AAW1TSM3_9CUCU
MEVRGANPFLFEEDEHTSPASGASNPFLMDTDDFSSAYINNESAHNVFSSSGTNPFAFDPMDMQEAEKAPNAYGASPFSSQMTSFEPSSIPFTSTDQVMAQATITINASCSDFFSMPITGDNIDVTAKMNSYPPPIKPTDLHLKNTNTSGLFNEEQSRQPPSKETQDLLMSVMGAMDATSSHLLNKIPPTRSPSPVSMRDLHSPSPTPEPFGDLLDVGDITPMAVASEPITQQETHLFFTSAADASCDINQNPNTKTAPPKPPPPRPAPPRPTQPPSTHAPAKPVPPKPAPPSQAPKFNQETNKSQIDDNDICLFGVDGILPKKVPATKEDILNLYNTAKDEKRIDLLCGSDEALNVDLVDKDYQNQSNSSTFFDAPYTLSAIETVNSAQDITSQLNTVSPEISQNDLQMDTSDSQSKESISSVTFNPFAANDELLELNEKQEIIEASSLDNTISDDILVNDVLNESVDTCSEDTIKENTNFFVNSTANTIFDQPQTKTVQPNFQENSFIAVDNAVRSSDEIHKTSNDLFGGSLNEPAEKRMSIEPTDTKMKADFFKEDEFDAFAHKFDSVKSDNQTNDPQKFAAWGGDNSANAFGDVGSEGCVGGFDADEPFDSFLTLQEPPIVPNSTPYVLSKQPSADSDEGKDFAVFIKPKNEDEFSGGGVLPVIAPPPTVQQMAFTDTSPRFNPFDQSEVDMSQISSGIKPHALPIDDSEGIVRAESQESIPTPLFDEDVSQPLESFPRTTFTDNCWEMQLRQPNKKKITGQRFWKKIWVRIVYQQDCVLLQLFHQKEDKDPFQELPMQPCYSVSEIGAQQYDQFGKIFTLKLQYIFYKERPGVRPGQVKKQRNFQID